MNSRRRPKRKECCDSDLNSARPPCVRRHSSRASNGSYASFNGAVATCAVAT